MLTESSDLKTAAPAVSKRALTIGVCTSVAAIAFEAIAVATAMPEAARDLDGLAWYGWVFSLFLIGMLFATIAAGRIADKVGPAQPMIGGMIVFVIGLVVSATSVHMAQLVAGRLIQGLGSGVMNVAVYVCIARVFSVKERPRMFTYISAAWVVPAFVGPPIAAWLTHRLSWHWVFWAVLPLIAVGAVMVLPSLRTMMKSADFTPAEPSSTKPAPLWTAGLAAIGAAAIQLAGQRLANPVSQPWLAIVLAVIGFGLVGIGLPRLMPPHFLRFGRGLPAVIVVRSLLPGAFFGAEAFIPLMLVQQRQLDLVLAGAALTVGAVGWMTGSWIQARPSLGRRREWLIGLGSGGVFAGISVIALAAWLPQLWIGLVAVGWIVAGFGMGLTVASTSLAAMTFSAEADQGRNASSLQFGDALGSGIFVGVSGSIFAALHPSNELAVTFGTLLTAMAVVALLAVGASLRIGRVNSGQ